MKEILLIIALGLIVSSNAQTCTQYLPQLAVGASCGSGSLCLNGYCNSTTNMCTKFTALDGTCTSNSTCVPTLDCQSDSCQYSQFAVGNETCTKDSDCFGSTLKCLNSVCTVPQGSECSSAWDCGINENCNIGVCQTSGGVGAECTGRYSCNQGLVCTFADNSATGLTCQKPWSKQAGDKCNNNDPDNIPFYIDCDIGNGLICGADSKCVAKQVSSSCTKCTSNSDCQSNEECTCKGTESFCSPLVFYSSRCKSVFTDLMNCTISNNCPMNQLLLFNQGSCIQKHCSALTCGMNTCFQQQDYINIALASCPSYILPDNLFTLCATEAPVPSLSSHLLPNCLFLLLISILFFF